ncbi:hypothetical protein ACOSP7_004872 [Xanthoceras sorbifolium]
MDKVEKGSSRVDMTGETGTIEVKPGDTISVVIACNTLPRAAVFFQSPRCNLGKPSYSSKSVNGEALIELQQSKTLIVMAEWLYYRTSKSYGIQFLCPLFFSNPFNSIAFQKPSTTIQLPMAFVFALNSV